MLNKVCQKQRIEGESMRIADKVAALLANLTTDEVYSLAPAERRRFADLLRHWAGVCDRADAPAAKSGVLQDLIHRRGHE
jgi:hypothetical protein